MIKSTLLYIVFIQIIQQVLSIKLTKEQEQQITIFQPFPSAIIDPISVCPESLTSSIAPFNLNSKNYLALSVTQCGVFIYDVTYIEQIQLVFSNQINKDGKTFSIVTSHENKYLWVSHSSGNFYGIDLRSVPFKIFINSNSISNLLIYKVQPWSFNNDILFLSCNQEFQIFDWRSKSEGLKMLYRIPTNSVNCKKHQFIRDFTYALVHAPQKGIQFYQVVNGKNIDKITFTYQCVLKPTFFDVQDFQAIDDDTIAVAMYYTGVYMYNMKIFLDNKGANCTYFQLLSQTPVQGLGGNIFLSKDKKYIYSQFRTVGMKIYDVSGKSFQVVQEIKVEGNSKDIALNLDGDLVYYSNSVSLLIFKKTKPNFNRDLPNLLLSQYQKQSFNWFKEYASGSYDFDCYWREKQQQIMVQRSNFGSLVIKYSGNGILEEQTTFYKTSAPYSSTQVQFLPNTTLAYLSRTLLGFQILDFADPEKPVIIKENVTMKASYVQFGFFILFKKKKLGFVANLLNAIIFSFEDPLNPTLVGTADTMAYTLGETTLNCININKDENKALFALSSIGILVADISDPKNPVFKQKYFTDGASEAKFLDGDKYVIIAANYNGLIITELGSDMQLRFVSKAPIIGNSYRILQFDGDKYVIVCSYENSAISLVNIQDVKNPRVIQRIYNKNYFGLYQMCISQDKSELFVTGQYHLHHFVIQTDLILHTQIYQLVSKENSNEFDRIDLKEGEALQIGHQIEMHLLPIYQTQDINVVKAFYYEQFVLQDLPSWMSFYPSDRILRLNVQKDSLKKNDQGEYVETIQQVVFLTYIALNKATFVNTYLNITADDSVSIYSACQKEGYIDPSGFIQESYTPTKELNLGAKEDTYLAKWVGGKINQVKQFIQYIINKNIVNYTTQFNIVHSLQVDLNKNEEFITTVEDELTVKMTFKELVSDTSYVQSDKAKFVKKNYSGILVLISDKQDEIKLEGSKDNINKVLEFRIKYSLDETIIDPKTIYVHIQISDGVNYVYENTVQCQQLSFLSKQSLIKISESQNLQNDFNQKFPYSEIKIQESFSFQISQQIFKSSDEKNLQYTALLQGDEKYEEIPKDFWLQFSPTDRIFTGTPTTKQFNDIIYISVNATDGYSYKVDSFKINPCLIPFSYALYIGIQIFGPIFGILGLYRYKHIFYNVFFKNNYVYTKEIAYVGELYRKQIVITDNQRPIAMKLWKFFLSRIGIDHLKHQLNDQMSKFQTSDAQYLSPDNDVSQSVYNNTTFQDEIIKKIYSYGVNTEDIINVDKKLQNLVILNSQQIDQESQQIQNRSFSKSMNKSGGVQNLNQNLEKSQIQNEGQSKMNDSVKVSQSIKIKIKQALGTITKQSTYLKNSNKKGSPNEEYHFQESIFDSEGKIDLNKILKYIQDEQIQLPDNKRVVTDIELKNLKNPTSILSQGIYCLLVEFLLTLSPSTQTIFDYMKSLTINFFNEIDWYKAYVNITPQFNDVHINPYPAIAIHQPTINAALTEIFKQIRNYNELSKNRKQKQIFFSLMLIQESLKANAIGFSLQDNSLLQTTRGESLHTYIHYIHSVKAFEKDNSISCCFSLYEKLDLHYQQKGLADNERLPVWINGIDLINGTILFAGTPEKKDIGIIVIKVLDQKHYVLRSFQIQIIQKEFDQIQNQKQQSFTNAIEKKEVANSLNHTEFEIADSSMNMFKKKKTYDFNLTKEDSSQFRYDNSPTKQLVKKNYSTDYIIQPSNFAKGLNTTNINNQTNNQIQDTILGDNIIKLDMNDESESRQGEKTPERQNSQKQFKLILKQESFSLVDNQQGEETLRDTSFMETTNRMCKVTMRSSIQKPQEDQDSVLSFQE